MLLKAPDSEEARQAALKSSTGPRGRAQQRCRRIRIWRDMPPAGSVRACTDHFSRAVEIDPNIEDAQIALAVL